MVHIPSTPTVEELQEENRSLLSDLVKFSLQNVQNEKKIEQLQQELAQK